MDKTIAHFFTGAMMGLFAYAGIAMLGVVTAHFVPMPVSPNYLMGIGLEFGPYAIGFGALGGMVGGQTKGNNGAIVGGVIAGGIAALVRIWPLIITNFI